MSHPTTVVPDLRSLLAAPADCRIADLDPAASPGFPGAGKADAARLTADLGVRLSDLQERLFAEGKDPQGPGRSVLVVLQGMDTSGKGGTIRHVFGLVDPQGLMLHAFKQPTAEELAHSFLWRIRQHLPTPGMIGIFDRSQYEDVLIARVDGLVPATTWRQRYTLINNFEAKAAAAGTTIVKCFLNVSPDVQKARLLERLDNPAKHWKYSANDVQVRRKWPQYMAAYQDVLNRCNTTVAPWYVIPSDKKWYRNWAVATILAQTLAELDPQWPRGDFDVATERAAVEASLPATAQRPASPPSPGKSGKDKPKARKSKKK